ncbi:MAG TPA: PEP/pyruvate-binding domain-containing protein [Pyrinomonadaceae bacterium]
MEKDLNRYAYDLQSPKARNRKLSGGKAANLNQLINLGHLVPPGIVVSTLSFDRFLDDNNLRTKIRRSLSRIRLDNHDTISLASRTIKAYIDEALIPDIVRVKVMKLITSKLGETLAVRSSATAEDSRNSSWAGLFDSYLEISKQDVFEYIKKTWASYFNARAISYNLKTYKGIGNYSFAVIVQNMINSEKSGIAFSINPESKDQNKIVIEATAGLGEQLVSGKRKPVALVLDKSRLTLTKSFSPHLKKLLSLNEVTELGSRTKMLERQFKMPVDIEWAIEGKKLFILQVRPITALTKSRGRIAKSTNYPLISDYELTFKVTGLSFLFADMLFEGFKYLNPLFTSLDGKFAQYFSNDKMEYAAQYGLEWLSKSEGFEEYQKEFTQFYNQNAQTMDRIIRAKRINAAASNRFFAILSRLFRYYSKTDNEFTNLTYIYSENNQALKKNLVKLAKFKDHARLWINQTFLAEESQLSQLLQRLSSDFGIDVTTLENYRVSELAELFVGARVPSSKIVSRQLSFSMYLASGKQTYLIGTRSENFIKSINAAEQKSALAEIKGQVANKGPRTVSGVVRVINVDYGNVDSLDREIAQMKKGEILVAEFTAPELMVACKKAKAIITDIGGMLSHAAIVSRELGIPCIVGTANATKALATGDSVMMDFELGVISKIPYGGEI